MSKNFSRSFSCSRSHKIYIRSNKIKLGSSCAYHALWPLSYDLDIIQDRDKSANRCNGGMRWINNDPVNWHIDVTSPQWTKLMIISRGVLGFATVFSCGNWGPGWTSCMMVHFWVLFLKNRREDFIYIYFLSVSCLSVFLLTQVLPVIFPYSIFSSWNNFF